MAPLTLSQGDLDWVREYVGSKPNDDTLNEVLNQEGIGTRENVVRRVLRQRLSEAANPENPAQFDVTGEYSQNNTANIKALQEMLKGLETIPDVVDEDAGAVNIVAPCYPAR